MLWVGPIPLAWIIGKHIVEWIGQRRHVDRTELNWRSVTAAISDYCDPEYVRLRDGYLKTLRDTRAQLDDRSRVLQEALGAALGGNPMSEEKKALLEHQERLHSAIRYAERGLRDTWSALNDDLLARLGSGELIAQGFAEPYRGGMEETRIKKSEWNILRLDLTRGTAFRNGDPSNVIYTALRIAKPPAA